MSSFLSQVHWHLCIGIIQQLRLTIAAESAQICIVFLFAFNFELQYTQMPKSASSSMALVGKKRIIFEEH